MIAEHTRANEHVRAVVLTTDELESLTGDEQHDTLATTRGIDIGIVDPANDPVLPEHQPELELAVASAPLPAADDRLHSVVAVAATTLDFDWPVIGVPAIETHDAKTRHAEVQRVEPLRMRVVPIDDRDLIVVEQDAPAPKLPSPPAPQARRQEYRQLFAKLRRG